MSIYFGDGIYKNHTIYMQENNLTIIQLVCRLLMHNKEFKLMTFGAPLVEEMLYRVPILFINHYFSYLTNISILVSSIFFCCDHIGINKKYKDKIILGIHSFIIGILLGYIVCEYGVLTCMLLHGIQNMLSSIDIKFRLHVDDQKELLRSWFEHRVKQIK